jgi:hypothetical protein
MAQLVVKIHNAITLSLSLSAVQLSVCNVNFSPLCNTSAWSGSCAHANASSHPTKEYFGILNDGQSTSIGKIFTLTGAFELAKRYKFKKQTQLDGNDCEVRGIPCVAYETCFKLDGRATDTFVRVSYFFSGQYEQNLQIQNPIQEGSFFCHKNINSKTISLTISRTVT